MTTTDDSWADYESDFLFPSGDTPCTCDHDATQHGYASCDQPGCDCPACWEHT